ncbi:MAG: hypothetical protein ICV58_10070 [Rubrobacteraceae bacterium]|nr:hypothetical protein [Rubrobacteraceae bacterium]
MRSSKTGGRRERCPNMDFSKDNPLFNELLSERQRSPSRLEQWFSTHPLTEERIQNTSRAVAAIPAANRRNLTTDTRAFQTFRSRVRSLPATRQ